MNIKLYKNSSDPRTMNKVLTDEISISVALKDDTNVLTPSIILQASFLPPGYNYCYIPLFNRYYFLSENRILLGKELQIQCNVDVLVSWKDVIKSSDVIVSRSGDSSKTNSYLPDEIPLQVNRNVIYKKLIGGNPDFGSDNVDESKPTYLLTVTSGGGLQSGAPVLALSMSSELYDVLNVTNADYATMMEIQYKSLTSGQDWADVPDPITKIDVYENQPNTFYYNRLNNSYSVCLAGNNKPVGARAYRVRLIYNDGTVNSFGKWSNELTIGVET